MKKLYTLILITFLFSGATKAQLILTKAVNEPVIGNVTTQFGFDSLSSAPIPKNSGGAQTWNFSAFTQNTVVTVSTYTTVASTPSAASFPLATIAEDQGGGNYNYYQSTASTFELNGIANNAFAITFTNNAIAAQWPINYLYSNTDTYSGVVSLSTYSGAVNGTITTTAPGNGTVMLPGNQNFANSLQVKAVNNLKGTINGTPIGTVTLAIVTTDYTYYNGGQKFAIMTVSYSKQTITSVLGPTVTTTATSKINSAVYSGINELNFDNAYSVYPNPASGIFNIALTNTKAENVSIEILNQVGQSVKKENLGNGTNINSSINTSGLTNGIYFVRTTMGNRSSVKKLIIE